MIEIFGKEMCDWCDKAREMCEQYGVKYSYYPLDDRFEGESHMAGLKERVEEQSLTIKTVPAIWQGGVYIGGFNELAKYFENTREYGQEGF